MVYEADLSNIRMKAQQRVAENEDFKVFLKNFRVADVDRVVHVLSDDVSAHIDCTQCANCCKHLEPPVSQPEIATLAREATMEKAAFEEQFIGKEPSTGIEFLKHQPCIFLKGNACTIYAVRPLSCADYPHLKQPHFKYRWKSVMANYRLCPIVFNVVEALKMKLGFTATSQSIRQ